jgi:hypothetical protein
MSEFWKLELLKPYNSCPGKKWSMVNSQLSYVIFGYAFGVASLRNDCAKRRRQ